MDRTLIQPLQKNIEMFQLEVFYCTRNLKEDLL
jgi:hypothetical protein